MSTAKRMTTKAAGPRKVTPAKAATRRPTAKPAAKRLPESTPQAPSKPPAVVSPSTVASKVDKPKKPKLVRDSFTIPKAEYTVLQQLKQRAVECGTPAKKSEVLRAGIKALAGMGDAAFLAALRCVPAIKTGRPAKG